MIDYVCKLTSAVGFATDGAPEVVVSGVSVVVGMCRVPTSTPSQYKQTCPFLATRLGPNQQRMHMHCHILGSEMDPICRPCA